MSWDAIPLRNERILFGLSFHDKPIWYNKKVIIVIKGRKNAG